METILTRQIEMISCQKANRSLSLSLLSMCFSYYLPVTHYGTLSRSCARRAFGGKYGSSVEIIINIAIFIITNIVVVAPF